MGGAKVMIVLRREPLFFDMALGSWDRVEHFLTLMPMWGIISFDHEAAGQNVVGGLTLHTNGLAQTLTFGN